MYVNLNCFDIHPEKYKINQDGQVFSISRNKIMSTQIIKDRKGYKQAKICLVSISGKRKSYRVHRLVLATFKPTEKINDLVVNHKNGNSLDNRLDNLEWATIAENNSHAFECGLNHRGEKHGLSKLKEREVIEIIQKIKDGVPSGKIAKEYSISLSSLSSIRNGYTWTHLTQNNSAITSGFLNKTYELKEIKKIKQLIAENKTNKEIALEVFGEYHTKYSTLIWKIKNNKIYQEL